MLITALLLSLGSPAAAPKPVSVADDPPIRVWLNDNTYQPGDRATVKIRLADDGYVVVLRADASGHLRILFPLDPNGDNFVKGGRTFEIRARGDREAFQVDDQSGSGTIFAAVSPEAFSFNGFVLGDHWDYKVLDNEDLGSDPEAAMVDLVHNMAGNNHFDYDLTTYSVSPAVAYSDDYAPPSYYPTYYPCWGCGPWYGGSGIFINFRLGNPYFYNSCWYDPFWCDYGYPYYGFSSAYYGGYYYPRYYYPRYGFSTGFHRPFAPRYRPPFGVPRRTTVTPINPRTRWSPSGTPVDRGGRGGRDGSSGRSPQVEPGRRGSGGDAPARTSARPASPPPDRGGRGGRDAPQPRQDGGRGGRRNNDNVWSRPSEPVRREPMARPEYRPAPQPPRMESRPAPRMESRPAPAPRMEFRSAPAPRSFSAPAPRGGGGGGGGGGGRGGRHGR